MEISYDFIMFLSLGQTRVRKYDSGLGKNTWVEQRFLAFDTLFMMVSTKKIFCYQKNNKPQEINK